MTTVPAARGAFWLRWLPLFGLGMLGVISLFPQTIDTLRRTGQVPAGFILVATIISLAQSSLLVAIFVAIGAALAPKLGLRSHLAAKVAEGQPFWSALRQDLPLAIGGGILSFVIISGLDLAFRPFLGATLSGLAAAPSHSSLTFSLLAILYGGITEELMMRWGLMTLFAWIGWRLIQHGSGSPRSVILWAAIVLSALLFGLGHLPYAATLVALTPIFVARTILLNGLGGIIFGWLYARRSLEAAIVAHATFHIILTAIALLTT